MSMQESSSRAKGRRWKLVLSAMGVVILVCYVAVVALLVVYQGTLIFIPPTKVPVVTPANDGLSFQDLHLAARAKGYVHAWWIPAADPNARTIVYFHGNGGVLEGEVAHTIPVLRESGANLLLVEYRGYGHSSPLQTSGKTAGEDALAAMRYLEEVRHIPAGKIVIFGYSIGTGVATQLAMDEPDAGGLILLSPITSVDDVADQDWVYRVLLRPVQWLRHDNDMANKDKIGLIHMPVLIVGGTLDTTAPPWMARELYARANEPKTLVWIDGAGHNDVMMPRDGTFVKAIVGFLGSLPKAGTGR